MSWHVALPASINFKRDIQCNLFLLVDTFLLQMVDLFVEYDAKQCGNIISLRSRKQNKASAKNNLLNTCVVLHKMTVQSSSHDGMVG